MGDDCISKVRVAMLEDYDVTSCYDVNNTTDTFVLNGRAAMEDPTMLGQHVTTFLNITTYNMDCSDTFHVSVYHRGVMMGCGPESQGRVPCAVRTHSMIGGGYSECEFVCDCKHNACEDHHVLYLTVAHPGEGGLCDITMMSV